MFGLEIFTWLCLGLIIYTYALYPLTVIAFAGKRRRHFERYVCRVEVIVAAYNEELSIESCIRSLLESEYEQDMLTIHVGSDCSTDQTNHILERLSAEYPQIRFTIFPKRSGKQQVLNALVAQSNADVIVFTDADCTFTPTTITELVAPLNNPSIGLVAGRLIRTPKSNRGIEPVEAAYSQWESKIKYAESVLWNLVMGADGACYAIRRVLFSPVPSDYPVDDFFISMNVLAKGLRASFQWDALCYSNSACSPAEEFHRKVRISTGNFQNLRHFWGLLGNPLSIIGLCFWSHKLLRWVTPVLLFLAFFSSIGLSLAKPFYAVVVGGLGIVLLLPVGNRIFSRVPALNYLSHFMLMNYALLVGLLRFLRGKTSGTWQPVPRGPARLNA